MSEPSETTSIEDFARIDLRVGTVKAAALFPEARKPAYTIRVDFGPEVGVLRTSAQVTVRYQPAQLVGKQVVGLVNVPARQIGPVRSEFLLIGVYCAEGEVTLVGPDHAVPNGARLA